MSEHPDLAHYTLSQTQILRMREDWLSEGRRQAADAVQAYAQDRLDAIYADGKPVLPLPSEDIVAALRAAAARVRALS